MSHAIIASSQHTTAHCGRVKREQMKTLVCQVLLLCCSLRSACAAYAPNHFLGTCLTQDWVQSIEQQLGLDANSRDANARLVNPFLHKALHTQRYRLEDPRTRSAKAYQSSCMASTTQVFGVGSTVDANGNVVDRGTVDGTLVVELNGWASHSLATMVLSIIATEVLGYSVTLVQVYDAANCAERMSSVGQGICNPTHLDVEVWTAGIESTLAVFSNESTSLGSIGYSGRSGLYTSNDFVKKMRNITVYPNGPYYSLYWEGYKLDEPVIQGVPITELTSRSQYYPPADNGCADGSMGCLNSCSRSYACTLREAAGGVCLVVAMMYDYYDPGYLQAVLANNGIPAYFCFLGYNGMEAFALDMQAQGIPVLFYHYEPDMFHVQHAGLFSRVFLPQSDPANVALATATFGENGYGLATTNPVSTDFPTTLLAKYTAQFIVNAGSRLTTLLEKYSLTELQMNNIMTLYINMSNDSSYPDPYFGAACGWIKENYVSWTKWLDRLPLCSFDEHIEYVVKGCNGSSRTISFAWDVPDPDNSSLPYNCDGGLSTLPPSLETSRSCDWITGMEITWVNWLEAQPACDSSFYMYNITECDAKSKRTVKYYWLLPDPKNKAKSLECDSSSFSLPSDVSLDCEYMPTSSPVFAAVAVLAAIVGLILVVAMILVYVNRAVPIIKRSQFELLELMIFGGVLICAAIIVYADKPSNLLCALRPVLIAYGFTTIFGSLIVKSLRVYRVFMKSSMKRKTISTARILKLFALFCAVDILIIGAWFIADFPGPTTTHTKAQEFDGYVDRVTCNAGGIFSVLLMFWKAIVLFTGLYISFLIRHVSADFQESFWTFASSLVVLVGSLVILPLAYLVNMAAAPFYVFLGGSLLLCTSLIMGFMLGPKIVRFHEEASSRSTMASSANSIMVQSKRGSRVISGAAMDDTTSAGTKAGTPSDSDTTKVHTQLVREGSVRQSARKAW